MEIETGVMIGHTVSKRVDGRTASRWADADRWANADGVYVYVNRQDTEFVSDLEADLRPIRLEVTETTLVEADETNLETDADCVVRVRVERMEQFDPDVLSIE